MGAIKLAEDKSSVLTVAGGTGNETVSTVQAFSENTQETTKNVWRTMRAFGKATQEIAGVVLHPVKKWFKERAHRFDEFQHLNRSTPW